MIMKIEYDTVSQGIYFGNTLLYDADALLAQLELAIAQRNEHALSMEKEALYESRYENETDKRVY